MPRLSLSTPDPAPDGTEAPPVSSAPAALLLRACTAAAACSVSVTTWWRWHAAARCPAPVRVGASVRWRADELRSWIEAGCPDRQTWQALRNANGRC
jgi:predicted DNA-binding transcriptional regulator AlpA